MNKVVNHSHKAPAPIGPYSQSIISNGFLFISGQLPINPIKNELILDIREATHQVMRNMGAILETAELNFTHLVKTTVFLRKIKHFEIVNEVYGSYFFEKNYPARSVVEVSTLPKNALLEIEAVAIKEAIKGNHNL